MKISIQGQDYTTALDAAHPLTIERRLNAPSTCQLWLSLPASGTLAVPKRNELLVVTGDDGTCYFTGYIAVSPTPEYAGVGVEGPCYRIAIQATSDEILLDQLPLAPSKGSAGETAGTVITSLVTRTGSTSLNTQELTLDAALSSFLPDAGAVWSRSAGQVANQARAAYRALNGALTLAAVPVAVHTLNEVDGSLSLANLALAVQTNRAMANDITACGEHEPVAYVTEYFLGDGVSAQFSLAAIPFLMPSSRSTIIRELFDQTQIDTRIWVNSGGPGYLSLGAGGLTMQGGNGIDGDTLLTWLDRVEMGGTLLLEAVGVTLAAGSSGVLAGFFVGLETQDACTAGFQVTAQQGTGAVTMQPIVQGSLTGSTYSINPANQYTLRVRVHCPEAQRGFAVYRCYGDTGAASCGGQWNLAPAKLQFEIQEFVNGVAGMPVTLYDGAIASLPGTCMVVAASSVNLVGSMRALNLTNHGSGWVVSTPPNGSPYTRRIGTAAESSECYLESSGKLVFFTGCAPVAGEQIAVSYRTVGRAVGRAVNAASQAALTEAGLPAVVAWIGSVTNPPARSSQDCRNAATAMVQGAAGVSALWQGVYKGTRASFAADVWPGDALEVSATSMNLNAQMVIRTVKLSYRASYPDLVEYVIAFANDWADDLAIKTSASVPADTWLSAPIAPTVLASLSALTVTSLSGDSVTVNTGVTAPSGGGFEVRRRDFAFMPGNDPDLVLRSTQPTMTFSRTSASERFYIRMYDGATPPNYSEFSAALFINLPLGS
jgi:hypothetical protein